MELLTTNNEAAEILQKFNRNAADYNNQLSNVHVVPYRDSDCTALIQGIVNDASEGHVIQLPNRSVTISGTIEVTKRLIIKGDKTNITLDTNSPAFYVTADACEFDGLRFYGTGKNSGDTQQSGIYAYGAVKTRIRNIYLQNIGGIGIAIINSVGATIGSSSYFGSIISDIMIYDSNIGIGTINRGEYVNIVNINAHRNNIAIKDTSGNTNLCGFTMSFNAIGYQMRGGNNTGHGQIAGGNINHSTTYGFDCNQNPTGMMVTGVSFFDAPIKVYNGSKGVRFVNCVFDNTTGGINFDGSTSIDNGLENCSWLTTSVDPKTKITATANAKFYVRNLRRIDGQVYNFGTLVSIAAKTVSYTVTTADADRTVRGDATLGAITFTLPTAVGMEGKACRLTFIKIDSSANAVTIDGNGAETINGSATYALSSQWSKVTLESDGANWVIVS